MKTFPRRYLVRAAALVLLAVVVACQSSDKLPPEGSTITVAANPATIPLASDQACVDLLKVTTCGTASVVATVASKLGAPLRGQDVRFSNTAGRLFLGDATNPIDVANIPVRTDKFGNATVSLVTSTTATVTAKAGAASGTLTISTVSGVLSSIILNLDTAGPGCEPDANLTDCGKPLCFVAQAVDAAGKGIKGVLLLFKLQNNVLNGNELKGTFVDQAVTTDANGEAPSEFTPDGGTCPNACLAAGKSCQAEAIVTTQGGGFQSNAITMTVAPP